MNRIVLGLSALALSAVSASAADMAPRYTKAPPMVMSPAYNWSGWYIGVNVGAAGNDSRDRVSPAGTFLTDPILSPTNALRTDTGRFRNTSFTGGGQIGYNYQFGQFVAGVETDFNYLGNRQTDAVNRPLAAPLIGNFLHTVTDRVDWFGTFRGRLGFTPADRVLLYATGGLAYGRISSASNVSFTAGGDTYIGAAATTRTGWTAGGGIEWAVANNWTVKAEYLYVDLGRFSYTYAVLPPFVGVAYRTDITTRDHIARVGLNYKWGGPVVAKY